MSTYTQENRPISIDTPLGKDVLLLQGLTGSEGISRLFSVHLDLLSEDPSIPFDKIVGQRVTITISLADETPRYFNGFISHFVQSGSDERFTHYQAEVVPWLWFLTRTADCRIFQNMRIPDIITKIFKDLGFTDFKNQLQGTFEPREYCVQYRETDFNFVSRLMEQYGIFYYFEHEEKKHTLVLANSPTAHQPCPNQSSARCEFTGGALEDEDIITGCQIEQELRPGKYALTDFNFETPSTSLLANVASTVKVGGNEKYEIYDYAGEYETKAEGQDIVKIRMEEEEAVHLVLRGSSTCRAFAPGYRFDLTDHYRDDLNASYLLCEIYHVATVGEAYTSGDNSGATYSNQFTCIPCRVPYRPQRVTPKPVVQGSQTAVVVGKDGEEIWVDKYGRVKVQFHWDREGKRNENSSCWIRVSHPWAGKGWGAISIPRIGQEVIVGFIEGDPDHPIIIGRVYNGENMPPYELTANQTQSGIKSRSTKGGGAENFNELRFEDKNGSEDVYFHAEKDFHRVVENDDDLKVGNDQTIEIKNNRTETVKQGNESVTIEQGNREVTISMGNESLLIKMGNQATKIDLGKSETEAMQSIELKVGQSSVKVDQTGVTIKGMIVKVEGQVQTEVKGTMTQVGGDAILQLKGGVTMIN